MDYGIEFFTATCLNWQPLFEKERHKDLVMKSLQFLVDNERIWLYAFVIMPDHLHLLWRRQEAWVHENIHQNFLKYTAQQIKFELIKTQPDFLEQFKSTQTDGHYHFWERRPFRATMPNRRVASQKVEYIHQNPVKAGLSVYPEDFKYSSARFYTLNQDDWAF